MLDQVAAIDWVKKRISSFGGSESDICIMGHGAGGTSVALHMLSPLSMGKFNRAIAMSGSAFSKHIKPFPSKEMYKEIVNGFCGDFKTGKEVINCYRNIEVRALVDKASAFDWGPVIDNSTGSFLPKDPEDILEMGQFNKVEFMTGYTNKEDILDITNVNNIENGVTAMEFEDLIASELTEEYSNDENNNTCPSDMQHIIETALFYYKPHPETSDTTILRERYSDYITERRYGSGIYKQAIYTSAYINTYVYRFDYKPKKPLLTSIPEWAYVPHGFELPFVWGMPYWPNLQNVVWNGADRRVVDTVMNLWGNFAKFGNPIQNGLSYKWEVFKKVTPGVMIIDRNFNMSDPSIFDHRAFDFWNEYFPNVIEATRCCNTTQAGFQIQSNSYLIGLSAVVIAGLPLVGH
ncbi:hypothetical protein C0J52_11823 [Blattella germanica]|nr:hypothetical protein C0J52_11823 [Blattella germanica]